MSFNSLQFLIFLPIVIVVYFLLPHKFRWLWLLAASYYAYMSWNVWLVFLILGTTAVSYVAGLLMPRAKSKGVRRLLLVITLVVCLGILVFFKYFNFLLANVINFLNLFALELDPVMLDIILPVGISFYTFQTLSYVIDVYRDKIEPEKHFGYFALYVSYFPQLVAGPIERPENLLPQLREKHMPNEDDLSVGFRIMAVGFFRKCVVADFIGTFVNSVFSDVSSASGLAVLVAGALFCIQLYCDFAGYSEIAIGAARMMGIKLMKNFDRPFSATSIRDLMSRWHISLTTWFRDYLYIPLGGSRKGKARRVLNTLIVYFLCGLWHGANWTYVIWGLYVGVFVSIENLLRKPYRAFCEKHNIDNSKGWIIVLRRILVFLFFVPAALFFRARSVAEIGTIFACIFTAGGFGTEYFAATLSALSMTALDILVIGAILVCLALIWRMSEESPGTEFYEPIVSESEPLSLETKRLAPGSLGLTDKAESRRSYVARVTAVAYAVCAIALGWLILIAGDATSAFVYFQF